MVWSLALRPDDAEQDPLVYRAEFDVVFLAEGPRTASIIVYTRASISSAFTKENKTKTKTIYYSYIMK